ncbi:MucBP domain-containing protein [Lactiplantibacillus carotarum]|uniref:MucBP domain-containing protein n=1 Tax=Lactiplantibacillus carotarum TaxID=2993456 RepID=UPI00298EE325|nr:MucBP domain-containing protein [Lactiplantibacillus carotarum]
MSKDNQKMTGDSVYRVKLYKDGKKWVAAGATTLAVLAGLSLANVNASADTTGDSADASTAVVSSQTSAKDTDTGSVSGQSGDNNTTGVQKDTSNTGTDANKDTSNTGADANKDTSANTGTDVQQNGAAGATDQAAGDQSGTDQAAASGAKSGIVAEDASVTPTAATVKQETPAVTTPTSQANVSVSQDAQVDVTSVAASDGNTTVVNTGTVAKTNQTGQTGQTVNNTQISNPEAGKTYNVDITLAKNPKVDWSNGNGQFTIKPVNSSDSRGTWKLASYETNGSTTTLSDTDATAFSGINYSKITGDSITFNFVYSAITNGPSGSLQFAEVPNANGDQSTESAGWNYTTKNTSTETQQANVNVKYYIVTKFDGQSAPDVQAVDGAGVTKTGDVGGTYTITPATLNGYTYYNSNAALTGTLSDTGADIKLFYVENTTLTVQYQDGTTNIADANNYVQGADGTFTQAGGTYTVAHPEIDGYTYTGYKITTADASGNPVTGDLQTGDVNAAVLAAGPNVVTFMYEATPAAKYTVTAKYVDENGNTIAADKTFTGETGTAYDATNAIDGYTFKSGDVTGKIGDADSTVTLTYTKNETPAAKYTVTAKYVDENGNTIAADKTFTGETGTAYDATNAIDGYTFKSGDVTGKIGDADSTVTLTYTKNETPAAKYTVTAKYVDENGNTIAADKTFTGETGTAYDATNAIDGYTFKSGDVTGKIGDADSTVTLTYTKNETPAAKYTVTAKYVDENGNTIAADKTFTGETGTAYDATNAIDGYTLKSGDVTGKIGNADSTVTLTYALNTQPTVAPTIAPTTAPTVAPTTAPTTAPTVAPTTAPTVAPTVAPTTAPTVAPTTAPTVAPTVAPTTAPTVAPTTAPTAAPTTAPTSAPTNAATTAPSGDTLTSPTTAPASDAGEIKTVTVNDQAGTAGVIPAAAALKPVETTKTTTSDAKALPQTDEDENGTALAVLGLGTLLMGSALYFGVSRRKHEA